MYHKINWLGCVAEAFFLCSTAQSQILFLYLYFPVCSFGQFPIPTQLATNWGGWQLSQGSSKTNEATISDQTIFFWVYVCLYVHVPLTQVLTLLTESLVQPSLIHMLMFNRHVNEGFSITSKFVVLSPLPEKLNVLDLVLSCFGYINVLFFFHTVWSLIGGHGWSELYKCGSGSSN